MRSVSHVFFHFVRGENVEVSRSNEGRLRQCISDRFECIEHFVERAVLLSVSKEKAGGSFAVEKESRGFPHSIEFSEELVTRGEARLPPSEQCGEESTGGGESSKKRDPNRGHLRIHHRPRFFIILIAETAAHSTAPLLAGLRRRVIVEAVDVLHVGAVGPPVLVGGRNEPTAQESLVMLPELDSKVL